MKKNAWTRVQAFFLYGSILYSCMLRQDFSADNGIYIIIRTAFVLWKQARGMGIDQLQKANPYLIASVDRALDLLVILSKSPREMGVTELSKLLNVQKSTVHSLLVTLAQRGFVRQTAESRYTLGLQLIQLGTICSERLDIRTVARPIMLELAEQSQEVALLAMLSKAELMIVEKIEPQRAFVLIPKFDFSITLHSTAIGKVLLANSTASFIESVLDRGLAKYTQQTLTDRDVVLAELTAVRDQGYAVGCNETIEGISCIAAPIYDAAGQVAAALSISGSTSSLTAERRQELVSMVCDKAGCISQRMGFYKR
jgi:IclR family acetate operon transcriptional repressor